MTGKKFWILACSVLLTKKISYQFSVVRLIPATSSFYGVFYYLQDQELLKNFLKYQNICCCYQCDIQYYKFTLFQKDSKLVFIHHSKTQEAHMRKQWVYGSTIVLYPFSGFFLFYSNLVFY